MARFRPVRCSFILPSTQRSGKPTLSIVTVATSLEPSWGNYSASRILVANLAKCYGGAFALGRTQANKLGLGHLNEYNAIENDGSTPRADAQTDDKHTLSREFLTCAWFVLTTEPS